MINLQNVNKCCYIIKGRREFAYSSTITLIKMSGEAVNTKRKRSYEKLNLSRHLRRVNKGKHALQPAPPRETIEQKLAQIGMQGKLGARSFRSGIYSPSGSCRDFSFMLQPGLQSCGCCDFSLLNNIDSFPSGATD